MIFLEKIQKLPESVRKIILWVIVIVLAFIMLAWWARRIPKSLNSFQAGQFIEQMDLPKIEIQNIKDSLNNIETNASEETKK